MKLIDEHNQTIQEIEREEMDVSDFPTDFTDDDEQDIKEAKDDLAIIRSEIELARQEFQSHQPSIDDLKNQLADVGAQIAAVKADMKKVNKEMKRLNKAIDKIERINRELKTVEDGIVLQKCIVRKATEESDKRRLQAIRIAATNEAVQRKRSERTNDQTNGSLFDDNGDDLDFDIENVEIPDLDKFASPDYYAVKVKHATDKLKKEMEAFEQYGEEDELSAFEAYERAREIYQNKQKMMREISSILAKMRKDLVNRRRRWYRFRDHISGDISTKFEEILSIKGFSGFVDFLHSEEQLKLIVQTNKDYGASQQYDVKALSGGEKSFSTIALLLGLGEVMEAPFRVMDEFDVFLDAVSRKLIIETLIKVGKRMTNRQFIFLTPQDVSNINTDSMVKIVKIKNPRRRSSDVLYDE